MKNDLEAVRETLCVAYAWHGDTGFGLRCKEAVAILDRRQPSLDTCAHGFPRGTCDVTPHRCALDSVAEYNRGVGDAYSAASRSMNLADYDSSARILQAIRALKKPIAPASVGKTDEELLNILKEKLDVGAFMEPSDDKLILDAFAAIRGEVR